MNAILPSPVNFLLVEDSSAAVLVVRTLVDMMFGTGAAPLTHADRLDKAVELLSCRSFDLILLDLTLPDSAGIHSLRAVRSAAPEMPVVVLTGSSDEELGLLALREGAQDYLIKDETYKRQLYRSIRFAMERNRIERAARDAKEAAVAATRAKSAFIAQLSHESRTPLSAIIGFAEMLSAQPFGPLGDPRYAAYAGDIAESGRHLLGLMDGMLDLSRIEAGTLQLQESRVHVVDLVEFAIAQLRPRAEKGAVRLELEPAAELPDLVADEMRLRQVLINLLTNAVTFTPPGGTVRLKAELRRNGIALVVTDTGIGISRRALPLILDPGARPLQTQRISGQGAGIGLPLCRRLVELHGGELGLKSEEGGGTEATVMLPRTRLVTE